MSTLLQLRGVLLDGSIPTEGLEPEQPSVQTIAWPIGADGEVEILVVGENGEAIDITDWTLVLTLRRRVTDEEPVFARSATLTTPESGLARFAIAAADTAEQPSARYRYDVRAADADSKNLQLVPVSPFDLRPIAGRAADTVTP